MTKPMNEKHHSIDEHRERKRFELSSARVREFCREAEQNEEWVRGSAEIVEATINDGHVVLTFEGEPE